MKLRKRQLEEMILDGESATLEFKRKFTAPEKIAREMIAFANTRGGYLLLGVDDDRSIVGIESEKEQLELIQFVRDFYIDPPMDYQTAIVELEGKDILVVYIPESTRKPHRLVEHPYQKPQQQKVFIRQNDKSVIATREMVRFLEAQAFQEREETLFVIGNREKLLFAYLDRYERITAKEFSRLVNISERRAARELWHLVRIGVLAFHQNNGKEYYTFFDDPRSSGKHDKTEVRKKHR